MKKYLIISFIIFLTLVIAGFIYEGRDVEVPKWLWVLILAGILNSLAALGMIVFKKKK